MDLQLPGLSGLETIAPSDGTRRMPDHRADDTRNEEDIFRGVKAPRLSSEIRCSTITMNQFLTCNRVARLPPTLRRGSKTNSGHQPTRARGPSVHCPGLRNKEIAADLGISEERSRPHPAYVCEAGRERPTAALGVAVRRGLIHAVRTVGRYKPGQRPDCAVAADVGATPPDTCTACQSLPRPNWYRALMS